MRCAVVQAMIEQPRVVFGPDVFALTMSGPARAARGTTHDGRRDTTNRLVKLVCCALLCSRVVVSHPLGVSEGEGAIWRQFEVLGRGVSCSVSQLRWVVKAVLPLIVKR